MQNQGGVKARASLGVNLGWSLGCEFGESYKTQKVSRKSGKTTLLAPSVRK